MSFKDKIVKIIHNYSSISLDMDDDQTALKHLSKRSSESTKNKSRHTIKNHIVKREKYSGKHRFSSGIPIPVRGKEALRKKLCKKVDVRYPKEISKFIKKYSNMVNGPTGMLQTRPLKCKPHIVDLGTQTIITLNDEIDVHLTKCATRKRMVSNIYKEHLQNLIMMWIHNVPIFYSLDFTPKYMKENIAVALIENINKLAMQIGKECYEETVKYEIDNCLNILPMWLSNSKREQYLFKSDLRDKLYLKIDALNLKFRNPEFIKDKPINYHDSINIKDCTNKNPVYNKYVMEIIDWLAKIKYSKPVSREEIVDTIMTIIFSMPQGSIHIKGYKLMLQAKIIEVLDDLPIHVHDAEIKYLHINRFAEDLVNRIMGIKMQTNFRNKHVSWTCNEPIVYRQWTSQITGLSICNHPLRPKVQTKVDKALKKAKFNIKNHVKTKICDTILNSFEIGVDKEVNKKLCQILYRSNNTSKDKALKLAKKILILVKSPSRQKPKKKINNQCKQLSGILPTFRTRKYPIPCPQKKSNKKYVQQVNSEGIGYMEIVTSLVRSWVETLPKDYENDKNYKNIIINDLVEDIIDEIERDQLSPLNNLARDELLNYLVYRWLVKYGVFDDLNHAQPYIADFLEKLKQFSIPVQTSLFPNKHHEVHNLNDIEKNYGMKIAGKNIHVLEDQISVWVNEQPTKIFAGKNNNNWSAPTNNFALTLHEHLRNHNLEDMVKLNIEQWLNQILKTETKEHVVYLTQHLRENIIDAHLNEKEDGQMLTSNLIKYDMKSYPRNLDDIIKGLVLKYIEHSHVNDDPLAKQVFEQLLVNELINLIEASKNGDYFVKNTSLRSHFDSFNRELEYIKIISDWVSNIPIDPSYNNNDNRLGVDFVINLAKEIHEIEKRRTENSNDTDYDVITSSMIRQFIQTYHVPILLKHGPNTCCIIKLIKKIKRNQLLCELPKIPIPSKTIIIEEIEEIKMRNEVEEFFKLNNLDDHTEKTDEIKRTLAERLNDIKQSGSINLNGKEIIAEITRCLSKLSKKLSAKVIDNFVKYLSYTEAHRKSHPLDKKLEGEYNIVVSRLPVVDNDSNKTRNKDTKSKIPLATNSYSNIKYQATLETNQQQIYQQNDEFRSKYSLQKLATELPIQDIVYSEQSNSEKFKSTSENFKSLPIEQSLPERDKDFGAAPASREVTDSQTHIYQMIAPLPLQCIENQVRELNSKTSLNEAWDIYQPGVVNQSQASLCYEDFNEDSFSNCSMISESFIPLGVHRYHDQYESPIHHLLDYEDGNNLQTATHFKIQSEVHPFGYSSPQEVTPEFLFRGPTYIPKPLCSKIPLSIQHTNNEKRPTLFSERGIPKMPLKRRLKIPSHVKFFEREQYPCECLKSKYKTGSYCMVPINEYCDDCGGFRLKWWTVLLPECLNF